MKNTHNKRMQADFGELKLASAADARRYVAIIESFFFCLSEGQVL